MPPRDWPGRLSDMIESAERIVRYTAELSFEEFVASDLTVDAVLRHICLLGEAARYVPDEVAQACRDIPWPQIRAMRNFVVHVYHAIRLETVWATATLDVPALIEPLRRLLDATGDQP